MRSKRCAVQNQGITLSLQNFCEHVLVCQHLEGDNNFQEPARNRDCNYRFRFFGTHKLKSPKRHKFFPVEVNFQVFKKVLWRIVLTVKDSTGNVFLLNKRNFYPQCLERFGRSFF